AHTIYFGIESGSDKTLRLIGKGIIRRQAVDAVKAARNSGLNALGSFIIGFPHEREEDIRATIKFADKVGVDLAQFTIATPYPGTRLWEIAVKENLLLTRNWRKFTTLDVVMRSLYLTPERIKKLLLWAYITFYLNPRRVLRDLIVNRCFILRRAIPGAIRYLRRALQKAWE
ncbi:MAG: radical SAM protein, partial [Nitrososphaerota archaeon]